VIEDVFQDLVRKFVYVRHTKRLGQSACGEDTEVFKWPRLMRSIMKIQLGRGVSHKPDETRLDFKTQGDSGQTTSCQHTRANGACTVT